MNRYRIVLADDHALLRQGLKKIIHGRAGLAVVGDVGDGIALLDLLKKTAVDMVIADISMPKVRGIEAACEIKKHHPGVKVLILTMHKEVEFLQQALSAGVDGYLLKESVDTELFSAIRKIRSGKIHVSSHLLEMVANDWAQISRGGRNTGGDQSLLTTRERQVLKLTAEGRTSKEIADLLTISARTVEHHRSNILCKLNIKNTTDLIRYAVEKGYV
jgi:DNA-binding NarL/FixJ family response regulator